MCIRFLSEPSLYWQSIWSSSKKWCWNGFAILPAVLVLCVGNSVCISTQHGYHFANFWFTACIPALYVLQESTWRTNITIIIHHFIRNFNTIGVPLKGLEISAQGDAYRLTRLFFFLLFLFLSSKKAFQPHLHKDESSGLIFELISLAMNIMCVEGPGLYQESTGQCVPLVRAPAQHVFGNVWKQVTCSGLSPVQSHHLCRCSSRAGSYSCCSAVIWTDRSKYLVLLKSMSFLASPQVLMIIIICQIWIN